MKIRRKTLFERLFGSQRSAAGLTQSEERVLGYMAHRLRAGVPLQTVAREEYVRRNVNEEELDEIIRNPQLVRACREYMEETFASDDLDPEMARKLRLEKRRRAWSKRVAH